MKPKILVAGDICDDVYLFSEQLKTNPEHSTPIYSIDKVVTKNGMAGNVERNLQEMGVRPYLLHNAETRIQKTRLFYNGNYVNRVDMDNYTPLHNRVELVEMLQMALPTTDSVIVSDYGKGFWDRDTLDVLNSYHGNVFIDPSPLNKLSSYPRCTAFIPNMSEAMALTGETDSLSICERISSSVHCKYIVLKCGEKGAMLYIPGSDKLIHFPAEEVNVIDVCGAGDTFISAFALAYTTGLDVARSIKIANKAAALTVQHIGVYAPTFTEWQYILNWLDNDM